MSEPLSLDQQMAIVEAMKKAGADTACPRCGNGEFRVLRGFFVHSIQTNTRGVQIGGPAIMTIVLVCQRCGFVSQHDPSVLGVSIEGIAPTN